MITFPIYLRERDSGRVTRYPDLKSLEGDVEPVDIENDEYQVWDSQGRRLRLLVEKRLWLKAEVAEEGQLEELTGALRQYGASLGADLLNAPPHPDRLYDIVDGERRRQYAGKSWIRRFVVAVLACDPTAVVSQRHRPLTYFRDIR